MYILSIPLLVVVLYAVFMRYVLNMAPKWSDEIARYLMVWLALLSFSVALKEKRHIGLTLGIQAIPFKIRPYFYLLIDLVVLYFCFFISYQGVKIAKFVSLQRSPSVYIPMWIPYLSIPIGFFLMSLQALFGILRRIGSIILKVSEDK